MSTNYIFWGVFVVVTCLKLLLIPSYRSTDFEVHRNWLALTHSLPIKLWYFESTSEWTLDYPPFFGWFEYGLSHIAKYFDPEMLKISNLNYDSEATVIFQRLSVIFSDFVYVYAVKICIDHFVNEQKKVKANDPWLHQGTILSILFLWNTGLLIVDHIHFQYNGFLTGLLIISVVKMLQKQHLLGAFWFTVLLNFKHIYLYVAPAYFVYLLRSYCLQNVRGKSMLRTFTTRITTLGLIVLTVFGISLGPFVYMNQMKQLLSRLFPFGRGLTHAYWAPNFWALYNTVDKLASVLGKKYDIFDVSSASNNSMTGGLVQVYEHVVLPSVPPITTLVLTAISMIPSLVTLWKRPYQPVQFLRCLVICAFSSFMFGWHVHEKAIILVILPLTMLALSSECEASVYLFLATTGHFSLFPLLYKKFETPIKILLLCLHSYYGFSSLSKIYRINNRSKFSFPLITSIETLYLVGLIPVQLFYSFGDPILRLDMAFPFLPLLLFSFYCALGISYAFIKLYVSFIDNSFHLQIKQS